jgi:hypothetical protein
MLVENDYKIQRNEAFQVQIYPTAMKLGISDSRCRGETSPELNVLS